MKRITAFLAAACILAPCSCTSDQLAPSSRDLGTPLSFKASMGEYSLKAVDPDRYFHEGDKIGLYAVLNGGNAYGETNTCLTVCGDGTTLTPEHDIYWNDWAISPYGSWGWAYYPFSASRPDPDSEEGWTVFVNADQSTAEKYLESDFRVADLAMAPAKGVVNMVFSHMFSKVVFCITNKTDKTLSDLYLSNVFGKTSFHPTYVDNAEGSTGTVKACRLEDSETGQCWAAIIPPQGTEPELIITTTDGKQFQFNSEKTEYFYQGCQRYCYVTLQNDMVAAEFSESVSEWTDDNIANFADDSREYIEFNDTLLDALIEMGYDTNADGRISKAEQAGCTSLDLSGKAIYSIYGLEKFESLENLILDGTQIERWFVDYLPKSLKTLSINGCLQIGPELDFSTGNSPDIRVLKARNCHNLRFVNAESFSEESEIDIIGSPVEYIVVGDGVSVLQDSGAIRTQLVWSLYVIHDIGYDFLPLTPNETGSFWTGSFLLKQGESAAFVANFSTSNSTCSPYSTDGYWPTGQWTELDYWRMLTIATTGTYQIQLDFSDNTCYTSVQPDGFDIAGVWHCDAADYWGEESYSWDMTVEQQDGYVLVYNPEPLLGDMGAVGPFEGSFDGGSLRIADMQYMGRTSKYYIYLTGVDQDIVFSVSSPNELTLETYLASMVVQDDGTGALVPAGYYNVFDAGIKFYRK